MTGKDGTRVGGVEARKLLGHALQSRWETFWEKAEKIQQSLAGRSFPDSADLIREDRER